MNNSTERGWARPRSGVDHAARREQDSRYARSLQLGQMRADAQAAARTQFGAHLAAIPNGPDCRDRAAEATEVITRQSFLRRGAYNIEKGITTARLKVAKALGVEIER